MIRSCWLSPVIFSQIGSKIDTSNGSLYSSALFVVSLAMRFAGCATSKVSSVALVILGEDKIISPSDSAR